LTDIYLHGVEKMIKPRRTIMNKIFQPLSIVFLAMITTGIVSLQRAQAEEGTCYLQAKFKDVFVIVLDMDRDGNIGQKIWQGRINANESVKITTPHARFVYDYRIPPDEDQPLSGGATRWCNNDEIVLVP
jgi:hypothetical protein